MIACIFGLTACGEEATLTEYEQYKVESAESLAKQMVPFILNVDAEVIKEYTAEEIEYDLIQMYGVEVDGNAFDSAVEAFRSASDVMGNIDFDTAIGEATARIDGKQIIVEVQVTGEKKNATAEIIFSNDKFLRMEAAALNPISSMGELMGKAGLNTLIGMGTVFVVLILISLIISCFGVIPKIQAGQAAKKAAKTADAGAEGATGNVAAQPADQEEDQDGTDDCELVAVIAAAVAAYEGTGSTDGFVVRSIRRR